MTDSVTEPARQWLTRFMDLYAGMDTGGNSDPVHAVREKARQLRDTGPTRDDPFTIGEQITAALPGDSHAAMFADGWRDELERIDARL
jgi:hypothetical protein